YGIRGQRFFMTQPQPGIIGVIVAGVGEVCLRAIADEEQVSQDIDAAALLAQQCSYRKADELTDKIQQRRFNRRYRVNGCSQIERLHAPPTRVAVRES